MDNCGHLRWYRFIVQGETPGVGRFYQTLWASASTPAAASALVVAHVASAGDTLVEIEDGELWETPIPNRPDVHAKGRAYFGLAAPTSADSDLTELAAHALRVEGRSIVEVFRMLNSMGHGAREVNAAISAVEGVENYTDEALAILDCVLAKPDEP